MNSIRIIVLTIMLLCFIVPIVQAKADEYDCGMIKWALATFSVEQVKNYIREHGISFRKQAQIKKVCKIERK